MFQNWLTSRKNRPWRRRLEVEALEGRLVPSTVRTITYDQITSLPSSNLLDYNNVYNVLSANGNRAVFQSNDPATGDKIYTIDIDSRALTLIDPNPNQAVGGHERMDISADGKVVLDNLGHLGGGSDLRIVNPDNPSSLHTVLEGTGGYTINTRLSPDGQTIFLQFNGVLHVGTQTFGPGLYAMSTATGSTPQLIVSDADVARVLGTTVDHIGMVGGDFLDVSSDGQHIVFSPFEGVTRSYFLVGVNRDDPSSLHTIGQLPTAGVDSSIAGISGDGHKVFRYDTGWALPAPRLTVYDFDGSNALTLNVPNGLYAITTGSEHVQLTYDGSKLLLGTSSLLINTDNSGVVQIGTNVGLDTSSAPNHALVHRFLDHPTMNSAGNVFLFTAQDLNGVFQLATARLDPASLGGAPAISNVSISPSYILTETRSATTIKAAVSASSTPAGVTEAFLRGGVSETGYFTDQPLYDDGTHGDAVKGDGTYTNNGVTINYDPPVGPRTVRISAETVDASGLQHVTTVEVDGLTVVTQAPASNLQFSAATYSVNENVGTATITVTRTGDTSSSAKIHYATSDGTALAGTNYTAASGDLTFNPGDTSKTFTIAVRDDGLPGPDKTVNVTLSSPTGATAGTPTTAVLTIHETTPTLYPGVLSLTSSDYGVNLVSGFATFTLTRSGGSDGTVTVHYATSDETALAGRDYTATSGDLTFAPGQTTAQVNVPLLDAGDPVPETIRTLRFTLSNPGGGATLGQYTNAQLTITADHNVPPGPTQFSTASYTADENDGTATITVTRTGGLTAGTVDFATSDGTAEAGVEYTAASGTLTFAAGETSKTFTVSLLRNGLVEDATTVNLTLSHPTGGIALGSPATAVLTIVDSDLPVVPDSPPPVTLTAAATAFAHSREHFTQFVINAYQQYLKRLPDAAGLDFWVSNMQAGVYTDEQLESFFIGSAEYIANHGGTGQAWVTAMYQDLLGRSPGADEVQGWVNALNNGTPAAAVALGFAASAEREGQLVRFNYRTYLGREATPAEVAEWVNAFVGGLTNEGMAGGFVGSPEYYLSAQKGKNDEARWVARAYLDVLFRAASVGEVNNWLQFLGA
jgi:hypothetical protein